MRISTRVNAHARFAGQSVSQKWIFCLCLNQLAPHSRKLLTQKPRMRTNKLLSVTMKLNIGILIVAIIVSVGIWQSDIANDQSKAIKISESVAAYNNWKCGYQSLVGCTKVFEVAPIQTFQVERIRYGKDFMAIKISQDGKTGWVIYGKGIEVYAQPNT